MQHNKISKWLIVTFLFAVIGTMAYYQISIKPSWSSWSLPLSGKTIVIDPGHGGRDGGAVSADGIVEKEINLLISLYLRDYLQQAGAIVKMTRIDDRDLASEGAKRRKTEDLHRRAQIVHEANADLFISIHMNAMPSSRWHGAQTFYDPRSHPESVRLAQLIQEQFLTNIENNKRQVKTISEVFLMKESRIPSALVEAGFLSNPAEAQLLANERYQKKVAAVIYQGILRFVANETVGSEP